MIVYVCDSTGLHEVTTHQPANVTPWLKQPLGGAIGVTFVTEGVVVIAERGAGNHCLWVAGTSNKVGEECRTDQQM